MNRLFKNEKGFGAVEVVLLLVIVVLVGVVGGLVYKNDHKTATIVTTTAKTTTAPASSTSTTTAIKIPPLGIQITVANSLKDLTYAVTSQSAVNDDSSTTVGISTVALTNANASCSAVNGPLMFLSRVNGQYPTSSTVYNTAGTLVKQFPTFYIAYTKNNGQISCFTDTSSDSVLTSDESALLKSNVTTSNGTTTVNGPPTLEFSVQAL